MFMLTQLQITKVLADNRFLETDFLFAVNHITG